MASSAAAVRFVTQGAKDLRTWLNQRELSVPVWCEEHSLDRIEIQRILNGVRQRVSVDVATDIHRATGGDIPIARFAHTKDVRRQLSERRAAAFRKARKRAA